MNDLSLASIEKLLLSFDDVVVDTEKVAGHTVYKIANLDKDNDNQTIFAIVKNKSKPVLIDLACDVNLAKNLRDKYETVLPSKIIDPRNWNQIICSGQISVDELADLMRLAYNLIASN